MKYLGEGGTGNCKQLFIYQTIVKLHKDVLQVEQIVNVLMSLEIASHCKEETSNRVGQVKRKNTPGDGLELEMLVILHFVYIPACISGSVHWGFK